MQVRPRTAERNLMPSTALPFSEEERRTVSSDAGESRLSEAGKSTHFSGANVWRQLKQELEEALVLSASLSARLSILP